MSSVPHSSEQPKLGLQPGHSNVVASLAFSPDGMTLASAGYDRTVILWDVATGEMRRRLHGHRESVGAVTFSPDGQVLASSDRYGVRFWEAPTGTLQGILRGIEGSIAFTADGGAILGVDRSDWTVVRLWDLHRSRSRRRLKGHTDRVYAAALSPDGQRVASSAYEELLLWDACSGALIRRLPLPGKRSLRALAFHPDSRLLAAVCSPGLLVWDTETGELLESLWPYEERASGVNCVAFSSDGKTLFSDEGLWDTQTWALRCTVHGHRWGIRSVASAPDGSVVATGGEDAAIKLWDARTGSLVRCLAAQEFPVTSLSLSSNGRRLVSGHRDGAARVWDLGRGTLERTLTTYTGKDVFLSISPDGKIAANRSWAGELGVWDLDSGVLLGSPIDNSSFDDHFVFSADGAYLVSWSEKRSEVRLFDLRTGKACHVFSCQTSGGTSAFAPGGHWYAFGDYEGTVRLWDAQSGSLAHLFPGNGNGDWVCALAFSPDGRTLASGYQSFTARLWDLQSGTLLHELSTHGDFVTSLAFSPDSKTLAVGTAYDHRVKLWSTRSGKERRTLTGHTGNIWGICYLPDGRIATAAGDGTIKLWNPKDGRCLATLTVLPASKPWEISEDWIAHTAEGYYRGSPGSWRFVRWQVGIDLLPWEAHQEVFHRPDLVRQTLEGRGEKVE
jgi:WD40 repeat protein